MNHDSLAGKTAHGGTRRSGRNTGRFRSPGCESAAILLGTLLLTACVTPAGRQGPGLTIAPAWHALAPAAQAGVPVPLTEGPEAAVDQRWWGHFRDPLLDSLLMEALKGSPTLGLAKARVEEARAGRIAVRSTLFPQLNAAAGAQRADLGYFTGGQIVTFKEAGVAASWEMDLFGHNQARVAQATALLQSAEAARQAVRVGLLAEVSRTYFEMRSYQRQAALTERSLAVQQQTLTLVRQKKAAGKASELDEERAEYAVSATAAVLPSLRTAVVASRNRLTVLVGTPPGSRDAQLGPWQEPVALDPQLLIAAPARVLAERPDIRAAERNLAASISATTAARRAWLPDLSLLGFFGRMTTAPLSATPWGAGADLIQPIVSFGGIEGQIHAADARQKQAFLQYQQTVLGAVENMEDALTAYLSESTRQGHLTEAAARALRADGLVHQSYDAGYASLLDVLDADRALLAAQSQQAASDYLLREDLVDIYAAAGGGWCDGDCADGASLP